MKTAFIALSAIACCATASAEIYPVAAGASSSGYFWNIGCVIPATTTVNDENNGVILSQGLLQTPPEALTSVHAPGAISTHTRIVREHNLLKIHSDGNFNWSLVSSAGVTVRSGSGRDMAAIDLRVLSSGTYILLVTDLTNTRTVEKILCE